MFKPALSAASDVYIKQQDENIGVELPNGFIEDERGNVIPNTAKIQAIQKEVDVVVEMMSVNLSKAAFKGESIKEMTKNSEVLRENSHKWKKASKDLKCKERLRACCFFCPMC